LMPLKKLFEGVYRGEGRLWTENLVPGKPVYGEDLRDFNGREFRAWNPFRSKLASAIEKGLKEFPVRAGGRVLYLGSSEGTTASHLSDVIGGTGLLVGVDVSERSMKKFLELCEQRENMVPVLADANQPEGYADALEDVKVDLLYQDVSQKNQAEIFLKNARAFLGKGKPAMLCVKARSIDSAKKASRIIGDEVRLLEKEFEVRQVLELSPFEKDHALVYGRKK